MRDKINNPYKPEKIIESQEETILSEPESADKEESVNLFGESVEKLDESSSLSQSPLTLYLKEISKTPLLTREEEIYWARKFSQGRAEEIDLLNRIIQILSPVQQYPLVRDFIFLTNKFPLEDTRLKSAFALHKKLQKIENKLTNLSSSKERRKLTKEKIRIKTVFAECLAKINVKELKGCQILSEWQTAFAKKGGQLEKSLKELHDICKRLAIVDPEVSKARKKLIKGNLRLVVNISRHYKNRTVSLRDLIQEGNLGLIRAVEKFDYRKGFRLTTYASWWIRESITRAIEEKSRIIRIPVYINEKFYKIKRAIQEAFQEQGKEPAIHEIARKVKMPPQEVLKILTAFKEPVSLESQQTEDVDPILNFLSDDQPPPLENFCKEIIKKEAAKIIETLPLREASILKLRFGIGREGEKTLEEVGKKFHVSRERVRQLENNALRKLRKDSKTKMLFSLLSN